MRSFFRLLKNDSATALSQQLPRLLMLGSRFVGLAETLEVVTAVLTALVRMHNDTAGRLSAPHSHEQRIQSEFLNELRCQNEKGLSSFIVRT